MQLYCGDDDNNNDDNDNDDSNNNNYDNKDYNDNDNNRNGNDDGGDNGNGAAVDDAAYKYLPKKISRNGFRLYSSEYKTALSAPRTSNTSVKIFSVYCM